MSLTVYGVPLSPFVRKVRVCLAEKALDYELKIVLPFDQPDWFVELNPLRRIPAMKDGDLVLADSSVICQYLEEAYATQTPLMGDGPAQRAQVRWLEKYADYELAPVATFVVFRQRVLMPSMKRAVDEAAVQAAMTEKLPPFLDYLEGVLGAQTFFVGDALSMADIAIACQFGNMAHGGESIDAQRWPQLAAWYERISARPSFQSMRPGEQKILASLRG